MRSDLVGPDALRRRVIQRGGLVAALAACGLLPPGRAVAVGEEAAFSSMSMPAALRSLGGIPAVGSQVVLSVPEVAENGAVVPISVDCRLPNVSEMFVVIDSNPTPMAVRFVIPEGTEPYVSLRVKMAASGSIYAVVRSDGRLYAASRATQVTVGGCG